MPGRKAVTMPPPGTNTQPEERGDVDKPDDRPVPVMPAWPTLDDVEAPLRTLDGAVGGIVEMYGDPSRVVYVPGPGGRMVAVLRDHLPAAVPVHVPRDLSPQPLIDPRAQIVAAGGVLAAGAGWGVGQALSALSGVGSGMLLLLVVVVVALRVGRLGGVARGGDTYNITNHNRWWGKSTTKL